MAKSVSPGLCKEIQTWLLLDFIGQAGIVKDLASDKTGLNPKLNGRTLDIPSTFLNVGKVDCVHTGLIPSFREGPDPDRSPKAKRTQGAEPKDP
jgi:hypothetical protein